MKKLKYYFGFSFLKPTFYWPIRVLLILYFILIYGGLIYDLSTDKIKYYSNTDQYFNIILSDPIFYYIYILPFIVIYFLSVILEFFLTVDNNKNIKKK
tara:strand:+ start:549 stop:842 length:294 start_codon:yes stop_codon:yes gene_type:complete